jgi:hypothetical protein
MFTLTRVRVDPEQRHDQLEVNIARGFSIIHNQPLIFANDSQ